MTLTLLNCDVYAQSTVSRVKHKQLPQRDWLQLFKGVISQPRVKQIQSAEIQ